jgi:hypothetical protein
MAAGPEPLEQERHPIHFRRQQASPGLWFRRWGAFNPGEHGQSRRSFDWQRWRAADHRNLIGQSPKHVAQCQLFAGETQFFPGKAQFFGQPLFLLRQRVQPG